MKRPTTKRHKEEFNPNPLFAAKERDTHAHAHAHAPHHHHYATTYHRDLNSGSPPPPADVHRLNMAERSTTTLPPVRKREARTAHTRKGQLRQSSARRPAAAAAAASGTAQRTSSARRHGNEVLSVPKLRRQAHGRDAREKDRGYAAAPSSSSLVSSPSHQAAPLPEWQAAQLRQAGEAQMRHGAKLFQDPPPVVGFATTSERETYGNHREEAAYRSNRSGGSAESYEREYTPPRSEGSIERSQERQRFLNEKLRFLDGREAASAESTLAHQQQQQQQQRDAHEARLRSERHDWVLRKEAAEVDSVVTPSRKASTPTQRSRKERTTSCKPLSPPRIWRDDGDDSTMYHKIQRMVTSPLQDMDGSFASITSHSSGGTPARTQRQALLEERIARHVNSTPSVSYSVVLNPKAGSVFVEIHRQLTALPFWRDIPYTTAASCVQTACGLSVSTARSLGKSIPSLLRNANLLLDDRYLSDKVITNFTRFGGVAGGGGGGGGGGGVHRLLVNSYSGTKCLTLKSAMTTTLKQGLSDPWSVTPETHLLNARRHGADQRRELEKNFRALARATPNPRGEPFRNIWIVKPSHRNKGIGIKVFNNLQEMLHFVDVESFEDADSSDKATRYVAQKYIERPFLIQRRKFDLRSWCVVTAKYDILVYQKGVMRTASEPYNPHDLNDELSHLTNHCIQEHGPNFSKFEEGNEMWYPLFQEYLDRLPRGAVGHGWSLTDDILPQVNDQIKKCLLVAKKKLSKSTASGLGGDVLGCFQLFGFDFMVDEDMKVWLIEINGSPASAEYLLEDMMTNLIATVVAPMFPAPEGAEYPYVEDNFKCIYRNSDAAPVYAEDETEAAPRRGQKGELFPDPATRLF